MSFKTVDMLKTACMDRWLQGQKDKGKAVQP